MILPFIELDKRKYYKNDIELSGEAYLDRAELRKDNHHFNIKHLAKISKVL